MTTLDEVESGMPIQRMKAEHLSNLVGLVDGRRQLQQVLRQEQWRKEEDSICQ
jgi:hypothetical protein